MTRAKKILIWAASGLVGLVCALMLYIWLFPPNLDFLRQPVEKALSDALGAKVSFQGPMRLEPALWPTATAQDVRMLMGKRGLAGDLIKVETLEVRLAWLPLLNGEFLFERVTAKNFDIYKDPDAKGQAEVLRLQEVACRLEVLDDGVALHDLEVATGASHLRGNLVWRGAGEAPIVRAKAHFSVLQLDDFLPPPQGKTENPTPGKGTPQDKTASQVSGGSAKRDLRKAKPRPPQPSPEQSSKNRGSTSEEKMEIKDFPEGMEAVLRYLLDFEPLHLTLEADKIIAGKDQAGSGKLLAQVKDGVLKIEPVRIKLPTGVLNFKLHCREIKDDLDLSLNLQVDKLDLGLITRRLDAGSDLAGVIGMDLYLKARTPDMHKFMANSSGHFDFAAAPKNLHTEAFSGWAVNLMLAILPKLGKDKPAKLNCIVSSFAIKNGRTDGDVILMDTTRLTVVGKGKIDFKNQELDLTFSPFPKNPELFSMETPVTASGKFDDIDVGVSVGALITSGFGLITSPIFTPLRRMASLVEPSAMSACQGALQKMLEKRKIDPDRVRSEIPSGSRRQKGEKK